MIIDNTEIFARFSYYTDFKARALYFIDEYNNPYCVMTVNIPDVILKDDELLIKTWGECEDMYDSLVKMGALIPTGDVVPTGFVCAAICKYNPEILMK
jgi:hypothetical protein